MSLSLSYLLLFLSAFGAATLLPLYSEVALFALLSKGEPWFWLWCVASMGNTLGAAVNWLLGKYLRRFEHSFWFPFKASRVQSAQGYFQRYGQWTLLLSWLPVIGDALTFIAGAMKVRFATFLLLTAIGKSSRYIVVIYLYFLSL